MMTPLRLDLARYREAKGWTQEQLAEKSAVNRVTIAKLESGALRNVTLDLVEKLANALGDARNGLRADPRKLIVRDNGAAAKPRSRGSK